MSEAGAELLAGGLSPQGTLQGPSPELVGGAARLGKGAQQAPQAAQSSLAEPIPLSADAAALKAHWAQLRAQVNTLRPVERFAVVSIAYRRGFLRGEEEEEAASLRVGIVPRMPVAWLLLKPIRAGPHEAMVPLAVPLAADSSLPDYVVRADIYDNGMQHIWGQSDRFRMFFGGKSGHRGGGQYYKGEIVNVRQMQPSITSSLAQREAYDPWEALDVKWEMGGALEAEEGGCLRVSPWEIEADPETEARRLEELRKQEEASARAARALAKSRRLEGDGDEDSTSPYSGHPHSFFSAGDGATPGPEVMPDGSLRYASMPPILKAGQVAQAVLEHLRTHNKEQLKNLLMNWYRRAKGKYKVPIFAHQELDLHKVFWEVQDRGGYDHVTAHKLWKDVCRSLEVDLTGQTSASYNMRLNYEKCLLEFESYLASGQFAAELAAGSAPSSQSIGHSFAKPAVIVGAGGSSSSAGPARFSQGAGQPHAAPPSTFQPYPGPGASSPGAADADGASLSFTELLNLDGDAPTPAALGAPAAAPHPNFDPYAFPVPGGIVSQGRLAQHPAGAPLTHPPLVLPAPLPNQTTTFGHPGDASWLKLVPAPAAAGSNPVHQPRQAAPVVMLQPSGFGAHGGMTPTTLGYRLQARGASIVGCKVQRFWPVREGTDGDGSWWDAHISEYQTRKARHRLVYDRGTPDESFEFVDFRELADDEIRQHPSHPIFPPPSPEAPMVAIAAALQAGILPAELHRMVDTAANRPANVPKPRSMHVLNAQPRRRKRSKRIKVEVPREPNEDDSTGQDGPGGIRHSIHENGHTYRNGSLKVLLRSPTAAPTPRPSSAASARAESPAAASGPQPSEDTSAGDANLDGQRASLRIRLRGSHPRKRFGDESPRHGSQPAQSRPSLIQTAEKPPPYSGQRRESATPSESQPGGVKPEPGRLPDDGAQSGRPRQTRLKVKPLAVAE
ncbi:hypothetical protein WJX84_003835 [Apatococcus fuscideae]|uniref:ARID domain-containing protein n=1 Tax=Apatococcus fuscideae TaxID=2026836 RepID=A0AAW1SPI3_9CHLO